MAKQKVKPFGRQISKVKEQARGSVGEGATPDQLAAEANKLAEALSWEYTFTPESFQPKAPTGAKRGRKPKATPLFDGTKAAPPTSDIAGKIKAVSDIARQVGGYDQLRQIVDVLQGER